MMLGLGMAALKYGKRGLKKGGLGFGARPRRRRPRRRLTPSEMNELTWIRNTLGKTAAAQALPYYMGRR